MTTVGEKPKKGKGKAKPKGKPLEAMAVHKTDGTTHIVGIGNIKVLICQDGDAWFAQGLDIDYAANGHSIKEVKNNFEVGLKATIDLNIQAYGHIEHFLKVAPQEVWDELHSVGKRYQYSQVSLHEDLSKSLGFQGINFIEAASELVA
jgi:hypothetical protein